MKRPFLAGFALALLVVACVAAQFNYNYYALNATSYDGLLLGPDPTKDLPLATCAPTATNKAPCIVMLSASYLQLKADYLDLQNQLNACQQAK